MHEQTCIHILALDGLSTQQGAFAQTVNETKSKTEGRTPPTQTHFQWCQPSEISPGRQDGTKDGMTVDIHHAWPTSSI
jgi:hypothetical protein